VPNLWWFRWLELIQILWDVRPRPKRLVTSDRDWLLTVYIYIYYRSSNSLSLWIPVRSAMALSSKVLMRPLAFSHCFHVAMQWQMS
jgi:hypothetical protein